ncbi:hypothetical protein ACO2Q0_04535 [Phenylobacterium sp. VNQ135]|uniref:hypothetical protein n=1 Tax=Phenylobacterium sp. VNQ135 TaxID=3400922 RepID=UPI003BFF8E74
MGGYGSFNQYNWVHVPVGTGTPRTGGTCNDSNRPVIFIAPGNLLVNSLPSLYGNLIENMVSNGYIVVYSNYAGKSPDPAYNKIFTGFQYAASTLNANSGYRMDLSNIGVWGHSFGAGAIPWLAQQVATTGWGSNSMWFALNATSYVYLNGSLPQTGTITMPSNAHVQIVAYNDDSVVDQGWAFDVFNSISTPASQKHIIQIEPDGTYKAEHTLPSGNNSNINYMTYYGVYKNYQAVADCARFGTNCATSVLKDMGQFSGRPAPLAATPALVDELPLQEIYHSGGPTGPKCDVPPDTGKPVRTC